MAFIDSGKTFDKEENYGLMKKRMENMDTRQYPLRIPSNLYKEVKIKMAQDGTQLRTVLLGFLQEYIKK